MSNISLSQMIRASAMFSTYFRVRHGLYHNPAECRGTLDNVDGTLDKSAMVTTVYQASTQYVNVHKTRYFRDIMIGSRLVNVIGSLKIQTAALWMCDL